VTNQLLSDRYRILQTLGAGGFGETFLAEDTHMPSQRRCVVKKLRPTQNDPALEKIIQERFQREAAILESLSGGSRQIPSLYAYFYSETDRQYYIVQEWIDGDTLSALVGKQGVLDEGRVRRILTDILPVFSYIHSRSIVHRDIKPDNIILRHSDNLPVLIDFGAVREAMGTVINSQGKPTQSIVIGTPGYMPSEQSIGRPVYSSDLYSLGLTAIYLLTGKNPTDLPTDPSSAEIIWRNQAPQISSSFAQILDKSISYHHRDRYQTAAEFLGALSEAPATVVAASPVNAPSNSNVATYAVSPGNPVAPVAANAASSSGKNQLLIGGAIAATIVGGALGTALFFGSGSKTTSNVSIAPPSFAPPTSATASPETSATATPSATPLQTTASQLSTSNPIAINTTPTPISSPSTPIVPTPKTLPVGLAKTGVANIFAPPSNVRKSPNGEILCSVSQKKLINLYGTTGSWYYTDICGSMGVIDASQISLQATSATPSATIPSNQPNPLDTVANYYGDINGRNYQAAWNKLPLELQNDIKVHPAGYKSFEDWWNSVDSIEIRNIRVVSRDNEKAEAIARTVYRMKDGRMAPYTLRYSLEWDANKQGWAIAKIRNK
jgi:serine/threonine protein kinase, bacterial